MNTLQYYLIDTIISSPEYHVHTDVHTGKGATGYDYLGQIEAEEESERKCRRHSARTRHSTACESFSTAGRCDDETHDHTIRNDGTGYYTTNNNNNHSGNCDDDDEFINENTPILPCTCNLYSDESHDNNNLNNNNHGSSSSTTTTATASPLSNPTNNESSSSSSSSSFASSETLVPK